MKRLSIISLAFLLFLFSCSKDQDSNKAATTATATINPGLISEVENASDIFVQKLSFRLLNSAEKAKLWQQQLSYYISANLNPAQKAHLLLLANYISKSPQIFDARYDHSKLEQFSKRWLATARTLFPEILLNNIASRIHTEQFCKDLVVSSNSQSSQKLQTTVAETFKKNVTTSADLARPSVISDCGCSSSSDYCDTYTQCVATTSCKASGFGCGFLLVYSCNGTCQGGA